MAPLPVTFGGLLYDRVVSLATGEVRPNGIDLTFVELDHPRDVFDRMVATHDFDCSELSASEYITMYAAGKKDFIAIPVFPSRAFRHSFIAVNSDKIKEPKDLNGKRIGVQHYTMTAAVWQRGLLQDDLGIDLSSIEWVEGKMEGPGSHGKPSSLPVRGHVNIVQNTNTSKSLSDLLRDGEVDATIGADPPTCLGTASNVRRLFVAYKSVEKDYFKRTGIFPIMHLVAIRRELYEKHPFIATALFEAFQDSKELARKRMANTSALRYMLPWLPEALDDIRETFPNNAPFVYGLDQNRKTLETLVGYLKEQNMIEKTVTVDELFAPVRPANFRIVV